MKVDKEPLGPTGFVRDAHTGKGRMDLLPWIGIMEVSKLCEEGAQHYGERNIDKGAPLHSLLDSGARHLAKVMSGYTDEGPSAGRLLESTVGTPGEDHAPGAQRHAVAVVWEGGRDMKNAYANKIKAARGAVKAAERREIIDRTVNILFKVSVIALNRAFGFGGVRARRYRDTLEQVLVEYGALQDSADAEYADGKLDQAYNRILGGALDE